MQKTRENLALRLNERISVTTEELAYLLSCGRSTAVEIGTAAGARVQVGKRVLWHTGKVRDYLDKVAG